MNIFKWGPESFCFWKVNCGRCPGFDVLGDSLVDGGLSLGGYRELLA